MSPYSLITALSHWQQQTPDAPALWWQDSSISYQQFYRRIQAFTAALTVSTQPGQCIAVLAHNSPDYVGLLYAAPAANRMILPLNARLAPAELLKQLSQVDLGLLIGDSQLIEQLQQHPNYAASVDTDTHVVTMNKLTDWLGDQAINLEHFSWPQANTSSPAWLLYTSGSTGEPKGAMLSQANLLAGLNSGQQGRPVEQGDHYLYPFPLFHVSAHNVLLQHQYGACVVLLPSFDAADVIRCLRALPIDTLSLAPTMIRMLITHSDFQYSDLDHVRTIGYGASAIPADLLQNLLDNSQVGLCQGYGMTELSGSITFLSPEDHRQALHNYPQRLKSTGRPVEGVQITLSSDNEVLVKAEQVMLGYWQQEQITAETLVDGWLHTGDVGYFDEDGYLYLTDRRKDMIISGGENVASREVEDVLVQFSSVHAAAVVATPDSHWGEIVTAFIQLESGLSCEPEQLQQNCRAHLAGYKTPRLIYIVETLPVNANGKIDKPALRKIAIQHRKNNIQKETP